MENDHSDALTLANREFANTHPGESGRRQPVHTFYGGAHLFKSDGVRRLGALAEKSLIDYAPDAGTFALATGIEPWLSEAVYDRVVQKLRREPIEDIRLDFEDGYGIRSDEEEDATCESAAAEVAKGLKESTLPPFIGIRIKPLNEEMKRRSLRTLDRFLNALFDRSGGRLPDNFVVTLPKITVPEQVAALLDALDQFGAVRMEMMIETPQSVFQLPGMLEEARGRCNAAHFGIYDYTASLGITASNQDMMHPACDFARYSMQASLAGTGVWLSDGATNIMPVPMHRGGYSEPAAEGGQSSGRASRLEIACRSHSPFAGQRVLSGMGFASGAAPFALRGGVFVFPGRRGSIVAALAQFYRQGGASDAGGRRVRRCGHRPGVAQLFPARDQLRCDRRSRCSRAYWG